MKLKLRNVRGEVLGAVDLRDDVFAARPNPVLVHQVMVGQHANSRQGTASTKTRAEVSGGGAKPRPQKHTGRARQGSIRAPQWRGGGRAFGARPRNYRHHTPKRMRRLSLVTMLSDKVRRDALVLVDSLTLEEPKTKELVKVLHALNVGASVLLIADGAERSVLRSARNIPRLKMLPAALLNTGDLLKYQELVMTLDAARRAEDLWGGPLLRRTKNVDSQSVGD